MADTLSLAKAEPIRAKALIVLLGVVWGFNWPASRIALDEVTPWTLRAIGIGVGALALFATAKLRRRSLAIPRGWPRLHLAVVALLNVVGYNLLSAFAQLGTATSRVTIIAYSMPLWATLLARPVLGERLGAVRRVALGLGVGGLTVLILPAVRASGSPIGILYALGAALSWAAGTVYLKRVRIDAEPLAITAWQLAIGAAAVSLGLLAFQGMPQPTPLGASAVLALAYQALLGNALAYFLWFEIVGRLPAATASLGILLVPVVGVLGSALLLGEQPTVFDIAGFALVFSAASCVLLLPAGARLGSTGGAFWTRARLTEKGRSE